MGERIVHRLDALEVSCVHDMLSARLISALDAEKRTQCRNRSVEERDAGHLDAPALLVQEDAELWIDEGVHHHATLSLHMVEHLAQLALGTHQGPQVLDRIHALKLRRGRARDGDAGLAGGIGDQVQMKPLHEPATTLRAAPARA